MTSIERMILDNQYAIMMELYNQSKFDSLSYQLLQKQLNKMADLYNEEERKPRRMM